LSRGKSKSLTIIGVIRQLILLNRINKVKQLSHGSGDDRHLWELSIGLTVAKPPNNWVVFSSYNRRLVVLTTGRCQRILRTDITNYDAMTGNLAGKAGVGHRRCPLQLFLMLK